MQDGQIPREPTPLHLPLSRYFLPQVCAYFLAYQLGWSLAVWLTLAVVLLLIALLLALRSKSNKTPALGKDLGRPQRENNWLHRLLPMALGLFLFACYYEWRVGLQMEESAALPYEFPWPPSETSLEVEVERLWANSGANRLAGLGRVTNAPPHARVGVGDRVAFDAFSRETWEQPPWVGSRVLLRGVRTAIVAADEETESLEPFGQWLRDQGVGFQLQQGRVLEVLHHSQARWPERANNRLEAQLRNGLPADSPIVDVYVAMLLGKRVALSQDQLQAFRETGTMHFFAISGLHIKFIALTLFYILKFIGVPRLWGMVIGLILLALYVTVTGGAPSAVRAFLMVTFFWLGTSVSRRQYAPMAAWMNAAFLVLLIDPSTLFLVGFQLSYAVVASIFLFGLPLLKVLQKRWDQFMQSFPTTDSKWIGLIVRGINAVVTFLLTAFCVGLSAWMASTPLTLLHFNLFVPGAVLMNVPLLILCAGTLIAGVLSLFFSLIGLAFIGAFLNHASLLYLWIMTSIVEAGHKSWLAGAPVEVVLPWPAAIGLIGFLLLSWHAEKQSGKQQVERKLTSFLPAVFLLALGCTIAIVGAWILI